MVPETDGMMLSRWVEACWCAAFKGVQRSGINLRVGFTVLLIAVSLAACGELEDSDSPADAEGPPENLQVYLLLGQSNMAGRGEVSAQDRDAHPRVFALNKAGKWVPAVSPIHFDKPRVVGVGPGVAFGKTLARNDSSIRIGLVPCAVGGSSIRAWSPGVVHEQTGTRPYDDALRRARVAMQSGELKGILWYQGVSDIRDSLLDKRYQMRLVELVKRLRRDLSAPEVPFIATRLAPFFVETHPRAPIINEAISSLPRLVDHVTVVSTAGLNDKGDGLHLGAESSHELGRRYAEAVIRMQSRTGR